jgi:hypothetical protein
VAAALAHTFQARLGLCFGITRPVIASFRIKAIELDNVGAGSAQCSGIATQFAECLVTRDELEILVEDRKTKA